MYEQDAVVKLATQYNKKTNIIFYCLESKCDLTICRLTETSGPVAGGKEILLFCEKGAMHKPENLHGQTRKFANEKSAEFGQIPYYCS